MSEQNQAGGPTQPSHAGRSAFLIIGLIIIAIISLAFAGYTTLNPHTTTLTQQQFLTNTQSFYNTQTITAVSTVTPIVATTAASTVSMATMVSSSTATESTIFVTPGAYAGCGSSGCYSPGLGAYGSMCQSTTQNNTVQCSGYLYELSNGCMKLAIPYINPDVLETTAYVYYTLQNLPSSIPPAGSWVTVTGQVYQASTFATPGETCGGSYIQVTSIS